jgi:sigma-B regulation protein RsbU (phosphoserine phosphatase)
MFEGASYAPQHAELRPGDTLIVYSDGITEAENTAGRPFDDAGLEAVITAHGDLDPEPLGRAILFAAERHAGDARLGDDLTALVVRCART